MPDMFSTEQKKPEIVNERNISGEELIERCRETLSRTPGIRLAMIYGFAVTGRMRPDSDVDVAVLYENGLNLDERLSLIDRLSSACRREIDLTDLHEIGGEILRQILCKGRVLIKADSAAYYRLAQRMIYNEADFMPLIRRAQKERLRRFLDG
ncbi:MAG: nucleotidyltransferase domain-containing protein [Acidobacteriota bacterium]|jgi:predicted nucleotidyltransferase|nr:nucleotidyltransferase domain-containing protein [Acidobacteriota bacterium]